MQPHGSWFVLYFQIGQALEFALKAYAIFRGATEAFLRNDLGHDLDAALAHAESNGLVHGLSANDRASISLLGHWYKRKLLQYPLVQGYVAPHERVVREALDRLIAAVFIAIWGEGMYRAQRRRAGMSIDTEAHYDPLPKPPPSETE